LTKLLGNIASYKKIFKLTIAGFAIIFFWFRAVNLDLIYIFMYICFIVKGFLS